ncbi:MAG: hypothetical protein CMJ78_15030 [Planctomycetaceae bacterium]|nr:hypothetical protein [Planctomycetaceae bacterium]
MEPVTGLVSINSATQLISIADDACIRVWNTNDGSKDKSIYLPDSAELKALTLSPNKKTFAVGDESGLVRIYETSTLNELLQIRVPSRVAATLYSQDCKTLFVSIHRKVIKRYDLSTGESQKDLKFGHGIQAMSSSAAGDLFAFSNSKGNVTLWSPKMTESCTRPVCRRLVIKVQSSLRHCWSKKRFRPSTTSIA